MSQESDPFRLFPYQAIVDRPRVAWPNGARVAVWVIPNIEHFHIEIGNQAPDIRNHSRRDYGNRVGVWRIIEVLAKHGVRGTVALNAEVGRFYPRIMEEMTSLKWELMGHGITNSVLLTGMPKDKEAAVIAEVREMIEQWGQTMRGWLGPGLGETWHTLDLLREHGVQYVCDWVNDDLPYRMNNGLYSIPYSIELNDMPLFNVPSIDIGEFERRILETFDVLYDEGARNGRVMAIALHPFLIGVPHRIRTLERALSYIASHGSVWFATGSEIIDAYRSQELPRAETMTERTPFEQIALLMQGGGALGAYQAGVYQALAEADLHPDWVAGISIGAINSAIIAGNPPEQRVVRLREFWETVSASPLGIPNFTALEPRGELSHQLINQAQAMNVLMFGANHFFVPRVPPPLLWRPGSPDKASYYDNTPLWGTLARLVDFDRINGGKMRFSVGAVDVRSGNFTYFDTTTHTIRIEHVVASGSLPPGFAATNVDGQFYWDGGLISNTPLQWVLEGRPRRDTLAFQIDLWSARGPLPEDMIEVEVRHKEIVYSSRNRAATDQYQRAQRLRIALAHLISQLPPDLRDSDDVRQLSEVANDKVCNIVHLIYRAKKYEGIAKDFEFSRRTMEEHWGAGYRNARKTLANPQVLQLPDREEGVRTFDIGEDDG